MERVKSVAIQPRQEQLDELVRRIVEAVHPLAVILFGSAARGEMGPDSDLDLLVIAPSRERFFDRMASVLRLSRDLRAGLPLSPVVLTPEEVEQRLARGDQFVADILSSGVEIE